MDFWTKGLRDGVLTPRTKAAGAARGAPSSAQADRSARGEKAQQTPSVASGLSAVRTPHPTTMRKVPSLVTDTPEVSRPDSPSKAASVYSGDGDDGGCEDFENDSVRVFVRVRPPTEQEVAHDKHEQCLSVIGSKTLQLTVREKQNSLHKFSFDQVLPEDTSQQDVFDLAGLVAVDNCLAGYNSSIFAYGQTGAGKTFTVIGQISSAEGRGLAPRVFEYLFQKITDHENARGPETVKYNCKCSFLEIYNETIADLLCPASANLPIREDPEKGPYVENLSEPPALNVEEMLQHLIKGAENRHTGETRLNRVSSRSHSVFMCNVEKTVTSNGISKCFYARLNLVDLAGSERVASGAHGGSNATGEHLKEACHINKSLTALGRVTTELVKSQKSGGGGHVPYRDSKLTFLLQSSLGGNAKTLIIANVSPSSVCAHETLSTLRFAKQTKHIRNDAKVNWTVQGDRLAMQREIERLRLELAGVRSGVTEPLVQANEELSLRLEQERQRREDLQQERDRVLNALNQARRENRLLDQRLVGVAAISGMDGSRGAGALATVVEQLEAMDDRGMRRRLEVAEAEQTLAQLLLQNAQGETAALAQRLVECERLLAAEAAKGEGLEAQLSTLAADKAELEESCSVLAENFSQAGAKLTEQKEQLAAQQACLQDAQAEAERLLQQLADEQAARELVEQQLAEQNAAYSALTDTAEQRAGQLDAQALLLEELQKQLLAAGADVQQLHSRLSEANGQLEAAQRDGDATRTELSDRITQLTAELEASEARGREADACLAERAEELTSRSQRVAELEQQLESSTGECSATLERLAVTEARLAEQAEARCAAEAEAASLAATLAALREQLTDGGARINEQAQQLEQVREEAAGIAAHAEQLQRTLDERNGELADLRAELHATRADCTAGSERADALSAKVSDTEALAAGLQTQLEALQATKADLEAQLAKQAAEAQAVSAQLEGRIAGLEADKAGVKEQLEQEQAASSALRESVTRQDAVIADLRKQVEQEETRALGTLREMSASAAFTQRQMAQLEEQHLSEVQALKDELDRRNADLKARDQEMVRTNFALKGEIDRLHSSLEQSKRDLAASKTAQEQMAHSHQAMVAGMNERLTKQAERYNELSKKHDSLKHTFDQAQREIDSWRTKSERLDHAMADVTRLIRFARNPPDSARSSLIMTRSEHLSPNMESTRRASGISGSRGGLPTPASASGGSVSLRINESPAESPRATSSRYYAASPAGSKVGSMGVTASHRHDGGGEDGDEWEVSSRARVLDIRSPGDQLPIPALDAGDA